mmetsp:Transcript_13958/g.59741  ORF Transcript_13958/g.59741 Transcript_13958/m.59741 type:complete len:315 (-) Transcript_13958:1657-2601(-)
MLANDLSAAARSFFASALSSSVASSPAAIFSASIARACRVHPRSRAANCLSALARSLLASFFCSFVASSSAAILSASIAPACRVRPYLRFSRLPFLVLSHRRARARSSALAASPASRTRSAASRNGTYQWYVPRLYTRSASSSRRSASLFAATYSRDPGPNRARTSSNAARAASAFSWTFRFETAVICPPNCPPLTVGCTHGGEPSAKSSSTSACARRGSKSNRANALVSSGMGCFPASPRSRFACCILMSPTRSLPQPYPWCAYGPHHVEPAWTVVVTKKGSSPSFVTSHAPHLVLPLPKTETARLWSLPKRA